MSQTDFLFTKSGSISFVGGDNGQPVLHSGLASPLTTEGLYGRAFRSASTGVDPANQVPYLVATADAAYDGGSIYQIPNTKAVSVRAYVRVETSTISYGAIGILIKAGLYAPSPLRNPGGYMMFIGYDVACGTSANLRFMIRKSVTADTLNLHQFYANLSQPVTLNGWMKIRIDAFAIGDAGDVIRCYVGSGETGSEIWTLLYEYFLPSTSPMYIPWSESGRGKVGWFVRTAIASTNSDYLKNYYIDRFQVFTENIPAPL